jgi:hypothetical protein
MAASPFQPLHEQPRHQALYNHAKALPFGELISYAEIMELTDTEQRWPVYRAQRLLEKNDSRTLVCERGVGYRVALPTEHRVLTEKCRRRSYRQLSKARSKARSADRSRLTADEARWFDETELRLSQVEALTRNLHRRVSIVESKTVVQEQAQTRVESELREIREAMVRSGMLRAGLGRAWRGTARQGKGK